MIMLVHGGILAALKVHASSSAFIIIFFAYFSQILMCLFSADSPDYYYIPKLKILLTKVTKLQSTFLVFGKFRDDMFRRRRLEEKHI